MVLILPFGMMSGYLTVAVAYLLTKAGVSVEHVAGLIAISFIPHTWKFLWAPVADTTLRRKTWYVIACVLSAVGFWAMGAFPATRAGLAALTIVVVVANVAVTFLGMSVESLMAYETPDDEKGRAGGWFQAGNLGGGGLGGGAGLWLAQHLTAPWMAGAVLGLVCLLCCIALFFIEEPMASHRHENLGKSLFNVIIDLWNTSKSRMGAIALILCFLPIGSGAAGNLFPLFATEWGANANDVAATSGALSGLLSAFGCMLGGYFCDRMDRKLAYAVFGIIMSVCAVLMAWAPHNLNMYYVFVLSYSFIAGLCYAAFTAVTLEAIGTGAAATKYSIFASLSNTPIAYMGILNSFFYEKSGSNAGLYSDAAMGLAGVLVFLLVAAVSRSLHNQYLQGRHPI